MLGLLFIGFLIFVGIAAALVWWWERKPKPKKKRRPGELSDEWQAPKERG